MRHGPQDRIVRREIAEVVANAARAFEGALAVRVEDKRQGPPKPNFNSFAVISSASRAQVIDFA